MIFSADEIELWMFEFPLPPRAPCFGLKVEFESSIETISPRAEVGDKKLTENDFFETLIVSCFKSLFIKYCWVWKTAVSIFLEIIFRHFIHKTNKEN